MDHMKKKSSGSSSSSSFTENLFGPKDSSSSSSSTSGVFSTVFGPSSMGLGRDPSHSKNTGGSYKKQEFGGPYGNYKTQRTMGVKEGNPVYQNEAAKPSSISSSIYYGGDTDSNGDSASRGNWWQGKNVIYKYS
ncbi:hypothetical protein SSX86_001961 [Deinandra increscens subsp. villosa]|uniref:Uncharacterized protein n=1 Tax=Deinandra increscens subsp. villosa TaxID=3103831 RepID=A0AAP0DVD3_9ASTR